MLIRGVGVAGYANARGQGPATRVLVKSQPDTPLRLSVLRDNSSDPNDPSVIVEVTNVGNKAIRAYSISLEISNGREKSSRVMFSDMGVLSTGLQAGQFSTDELGFRASGGEATQMAVGIDLVEFTDGVTWGPDAENSTEILAGRRAGEREAGRRLLKLHKEKGINEALKHLGESSTPPDGYPTEWKEGFRGGQSGIARRIKEAMGRGGAKQAEEELRKLAEKLRGGE
jgi:hypothetical protein